jgi:hypothetical protein
MRMLNYCFAMAFGLSMISAPVLAQEVEIDSFVAISEIGDSNQEIVLTPLPDGSLDSIEGTGICFGCPSINLHITVAPITQLNVINQISFALGRNITQTSGASAFNTAGGFLRRP